MSLTAVMLHYGDSLVTLAAIRSLRKKIGTHSLIVVNNSASLTPELTQIIPNTLIIECGGNVGFARAMNKGIKRAFQNKDCEAVLLLNNDVTFESGNLDQLLLTLRLKPTCGCVAPVLHHGSVYDWGGYFSRAWGTVKHRNFPGIPKTVITVDHVAAAAMMIPRRTVEKIGYFDERFFLYYEDVDYCLRIRLAGMTVHINPSVVVKHRGSVSSSLLRRTLHSWRSHLLLIVKHIPVAIYPTAFLYDWCIYPLLVLKAIIWPK